MVFIANLPQRTKNFCCHYRMEIEYTFLFLFLHHLGFHQKLQEIHHCHTGYSGKREQRVVWEFVLLHLTMFPLVLLGCSSFYRLPHIDGFRPFNFLFKKKKMGNERKYTNTHRTISWRWWWYLFQCHHHRLCLQPIVPVEVPFQQHPWNQMAFFDVCYYGAAIFFYNYVCLHQNLTRCETYHRITKNQHIQMKKATIKWS